MEDPYGNMPPIDEAFLSDINMDNIDFNFDDFALFDDLPIDDFLNLSCPDYPITVSHFPSPPPTSAHQSHNDNLQNLKKNEKICDFSEISSNLADLEKVENLCDFSENLKNRGDFSENSSNSGNLRKIENSADNLRKVEIFRNSGDLSDNSENSGDLKKMENFSNISDFGNLSDNSKKVENVGNSCDLGSFSENSDNLQKVENFGNSRDPSNSDHSENLGNLRKSPVSDLSDNFSNGIVDQKVKSRNFGNKESPVSDLSENLVKSEEESNNSALKRKKNGDLENRISKCKKPNLEGDGNSDMDEKKIARLVRNRESAQLSRQRKKHYIEELEDKVRLMQSTIQDLNSRITYVMAENASLRMQAGGVPPPGMYPPPPMGYPWVPYMVKQQGSQVPLVPIPRLKSQQPKPAPKVKKSESKTSKTKKVASVSFLGLLFFMLLFGGFVPMVNLKFKELNGTALAGSGYFSIGVFNYRQSGRITSVNGSDRDVGMRKDSIGIGHCGKGGKLDGEKGCGNSSEPLVASLYVPRNDKLVKIDGNLIIHSIMASEKAMASSKDGVKKEETSLALPRPSIIPLTGRNRHPHPYRGSVERHRALGGEKDKMMSSPADGKLQQWFMEGLAGPMLSSGMCTEVFQFIESPVAGAIVPATSVMTTSGSQNLKNVTANGVKGHRNRRILHSPQVPLGGSESNITKQPLGIEPGENKLQGNNSLLSMVVSVLVDPKEAGDGVGDGVMGRKSLSRIFVVVLVDSVKYVTYSCMMPQIGSGAHLTT